MKTVMALSSQTRFRRTHTKTKTGCDTCKRRRVKCDETRPFCLKCVSTGRTCHGYHPPRPWIFDPEAPKSGEARRLVPLASSDSFESVADTVHTDGSSRRVIGDDVFQHGLASTSIYLDWSAAYREPLITSFLSKFLSSRSTTSSTASSHNFTGWPNIACKLAGVPRHEFLTTALMSASLCILSFEEQDPRLWSGAVSIYQQSLPRLRRAISRLSQCHSDSLRKAVIAACFVLGLEEFMMSSSVSADAHMEGIETIVRHGGPEVLEDDGVRRLFYDHQPIWLCICTTRKQLPAYAKPEWLAAVKKYGDGLSQTIFQTLWLKITQLVSCFVEYDQAKENASVKDLWQFTSKFKTKIESLNEWRSVDRLPEASKGSNLFRGTEQARKMWNDILEEKGLEVATSLAYHAAFLVHHCLAKLDIAYRLQQKGVSAEEVFSDARAGLRENVGLLMETLPFNIRPEHGLEGAVHMPFVMDSCWKACTALEDLSPDILAFFNEIGGRMKRRGFQSLTEPWLDFASDGSPATFSTADESP